MSGLRKCESCGALFRIANDGPEAMRPDGSFPRHVCDRCDYMNEVLLGFSGMPDVRTSIVVNGSGPEAHIVMPHTGKEAHVLSIRWAGREKLVADVTEEVSGKILHDEVAFAPGGEDALEPLILGLL